MLLILSCTKPGPHVDGYFCLFPHWSASQSSSLSWATLHKQPSIIFNSYYRAWNKMGTNNCNEWVYEQVNKYPCLKSSKKFHCLYNIVQDLKVDAKDHPCLLQISSKRIAKSADAEICGIPISYMYTDIHITCIPFIISGVLMWLIYCKCYVNFAILLLKIQSHDS